MTNTRVSTKSLKLYAEEIGIDLWFPQTIDEYFRSLVEDMDNAAPGIVHLFREILVYVVDVPNYLPPAMEEGDTVENDWLPADSYYNDWLPADSYYVAGVHDYGFWVLREDGSGYDRIDRYDPSLWSTPVVKTISFRPCGVASCTSEIDREV